MPRQNNAVDDPISQNVAGVQELIGSKTNKTEGPSGSRDGTVTDLRDAFTLDMSDEDLLKLRDLWEKDYEPYRTKIAERQKANKKYYLGRQLEGTQYNVEFPIAANLLFEAVETFLPAALSRNPQPVVWGDNSEPGTALARDVKTMLQAKADELVLRQKLSRMVRHWAIYYIGVIKHGWDEKTGDITSSVRLPQNFTFDPTGTVDEYGDYDGYLGEHIEITADDLIAMFPKEKAYIAATVKDLLGTKVVYTEWWNASGEYCFYTYKRKVLGKNKNPNWSYDTEQDDTDEQGSLGSQTIAGVNHFKKPKKPYTFFSVFSLGEQPHDITSLLEQNIPNQNLITKRTMQIDANLSRQNNSVAYSGDNFNQQTAKQAAQAMEKGNPVIVPSGRPIQEAIVPFPAQGYPAAAFQALETDKTDLRSSFGTQGLTAEKPNEDTTARGMILNQQRDSTRIGGGIGDRLEQVADNIFNHWTQLFYVFYDTPKTASIIGGTKAVEYSTLSHQRFQGFNMALTVSVAAGSMKPKDEVTEMNQAMELYTAGVLDPKSLLTILNVPDVQKTIENTVLWLSDKNAYLQLNFPELLQQLQQIAQQNMAAQAQPGGQPSAPGQGQVPAEGQPTLGGEPAQAALSSVQLPQLSTPAQ